MCIQCCFIVAIVGRSFITQETGVDTRACINLAVNPCRAIKVDHVFAAVSISKGLSTHQGLECRMLQSAKTRMCSNCTVSPLHSTFGLIRSICLR